MTDADPVKVTAETPDAPARTLFQQQWEIYRTLVDENYLFHREAYACLHQILVTDAPQPFRFLDIACGDATASASALIDTRVAHYYGIDASQSALDLAEVALAALDCPVTLEHADFVEALRDRPLSADVAWIGLSLHHLQASEKLALMRQIRGIIGDTGLFLFYEDTSPDGEDRDSWLQRWDDQKPLWTAYTPEGWDTITAHVHAADYPETISQWLILGREAGFSQVREVFVAPSNLLRMYCLTG